VLTHPWWLRAYGEFLALERPTRPGGACVVLGGDHRHQRAAELLHQGTVTEIWLLEREASYAVKAGILRPHHAMEIDHLRSLGIADDQIRVLPGGMRDVDDAARMIVDAARETPETSVLVLCDCLHSRNMLLVLDAVQEEPRATEIGVETVPADAFDERSWWKSRSGWKDTFNATCQILFTRIHGVDRARVPFPWDADEYERDFLTTHAGAMQECHAAE
ncbi:MAG: hypothetical protein KF861_17910, partial [Planctomycetaceae bacterium]|nr:hypothetical protein [Planctomycetaceae bacterium]